MVDGVQRITQNTTLSVALVIVLLGATATTVGSFALLKTEQQNIKEEVTKIQDEYVPKSEIQIELRTIREKLDRALEYGTCK